MARRRLIIHYIPTQFLGMITKPDKIFQSKKNTSVPPAGAFQHYIVSDKKASDDELVKFLRDIYLNK
jgi:hypothetical protein